MKRVIVKLAVRNLMRSPRRTVLTTVAIVCGVAASIIGRGFVSGVEESIIVAATDDTVGHVTARPVDYPDRPMQHPVDKLLDVNEQTRAFLEQEAAGFTQRTYFAPLLAHGSESLRVMAIGIDPHTDANVFSHGRWQVEGRLPFKDDLAIAVSPRVARLLDISIDGEVVLQTRTHAGAINALAVPVVGILRAGNTALDSRGVWMSQALAQKLLATQKPSHLSVRLSSRAAAATFAPRLQEAMGEQASMVTWESETAELIRLQAIRRQALDAVVFVLFALSAFGIANTILMAAYERVREVGTLRSMGMTSGGVSKLFMLEGALVGSSGGLLGALLGGGLVMHWAMHPIDFSEALEQQSSGISVATLIYTAFDTSTVVASLVLAIVVAVVASIYPARVAARLVPADAVRASQ